MKLAIIGSRNCPPVDMAELIDEVPDMIISGGAKGVDKYAKEYAESHNIEFQEILPDYRMYGRGAPLIRDRTIVESSDEVLAIWDGKSKGTKYTIDYAKEIGKPIKVKQVKL